MREEYAVNEHVRAIISPLGVSFFDAGRELVAVPEEALQAIASQQRELAHLVKPLDSYAAQNVVSLLATQYGPAAVLINMAIDARTQGYVLRFENTRTSDVYVVATWGEVRAMQDAIAQGAQRKAGGDE
jgi:hypothetical protein